MTLAKICGLSTAAAVEAALEGRAAFLGFMFFERSPRHVAPADAAQLAQPGRGRSRIVAVTVDADDERLDALIAELKPDLVQLHGGETPQRVAALRRRYDVGLIKVIPVSEAVDVDAARAYEGLVDHLMFETRPPPDATRPGGLGVRFDGSIMRGRVFERPWFLAGGLDPWNVGEAVHAANAPMVDVSSGVERGAGLKDPALIGAFLEAVRRV